MLKFENVTMSYGDHKIISSLNLEIKEGQLAVLIGPSGCGKTTTLQLINRLINPVEGKIYINGEDIQNIDPVKLRRNIGYVIQEIGLFPHMTIEENIEIVPRLQKWPEDKRKKRTKELLNLVGMDEKFLKRYPSSLSGGQQQRIGLLRALAIEPPIILMDEPFGALDPITRDSLQDEIKKLQKKLKKTIVFVTHDMDEAIKLADVIILMKDGQVIQADSPEELLTNPANEFVEQFIGKHRISNGAKLEAVKDIMKNDPVVITPDKSIVESIALMQHKSVSGLLVVNEENKLLGSVSIEDISENKKVGMTIGEIQHKDIPKVTPETSAKEAFNIMIDKHIDALAVVDADNHVVGIVTKTSMVKSLAQVVWKDDNNE